MQPRIPSRPGSEPHSRVLGVLAGRDMPLGLLKRWADSADLVLAADAGLDRLLEAGSSAHTVVGDMDSSQAQAQFEGERLQDASEEHTDADKLLRLAGERGARQVTLASVEGDQLDHMLATLHSAARSPLDVRLALRTGLGWVVKPGRDYVFRTVPARRVSLLPLGEVRGANLTGVRWPLHSADLHPTGITSISNRAVDPVLTLTLEAGVGFLFIGYLEEEMPVW